MKSTYSTIELRIMAYRNIMAERGTTEEMPLETQVSLKRKFDEANKLNFAQPSTTALNDLICAFAKKGCRWLEVERESLSFDLMPLLQPALVQEMAADKMLLVRNNFRYTVSSLNAKMPAMDFLHRDLSQPLDEKPKERYDFISSIGSLNRFFATEESAKQLFKNLASCLSDDGHLLCVFRSASDLVSAEDRHNANKRVRYESSLSPDDPMHDTDQILQGLLQTLYEKKEKPSYTYFGSLLPSEVQKLQPSEEYLVFRNVVQSIAQSYGLLPVIAYPEALAAHFEPCDAKKPFKHFKDTCYVSVLFRKDRKKYKSIIQG